MLFNMYVSVVAPAWAVTFLNPTILSPPLPVPVKVSYSNTSLFVLPLNYDIELHLYKN